MSINPFANESESVEISGLTFENRTDRISIYGDIDITRDKKGLEAARQISAIFAKIVQRLESESLPQSIEPPKDVEVVKNPFE